MLKVRVLEQDGTTAVATGKAVVIVDESTGVPLAMVRQTGGMVEFLTQADEDFEQRVSESFYDSDLSSAKSVVRKSL